MVKVTPQQGAEKWKNRLSAASPEIAQGIDRVTRAPGAAAAAATDKWRQRTMDAAEKFRRNVGNVTLADWQKAAKDGVGRVASGAAAKVGKVEAFQTEFFPHLERGQAAIANMPSTTVEDGINRAAAMIRHNAAFKRGKS